MQEENDNFPLLTGGEQLFAKAASEFLRRRAGFMCTKPCVFLAVFLMGFIIVLSCCDQVTSRILNQIEGIRGIQGWSFVMQNQWYFQRVSSKAPMMFNRSADTALPSRVCKLVRIHHMLEALGVLVLYGASLWKACSQNSKFRNCGHLAKAMSCNCVVDQNINRLNNDSNSKNLLAVRNKKKKKKKKPYYSSPVMI
ncbi:hypothetical protein BDF20DRAFT_988398 [Mycotypha africana]|uniref:uncharacterized protein n=1 Tax=Mycotypha africana TaxID=64632 RepID=UPI00230140FE|nr:uncharacterized protein BDF20DRAFT_988398 [Mycotypha africana]KAI8977445.1 hypothetical protein BDF20DRAFT_988398 [Mycotypha africana]